MNLERAAMASFPSSDKYHMHDFRNRRSPGGGMPQYKLPQRFPFGRARVTHYLTHILMTRPILLFLFLLMALGLAGQDIHFSQFMNTPLNVSPGRTGVFSGNARLGATYRSQWTQVPVGYRTFSVYADKKFICGREKPGFWSLGLALNHDRAGDSRLALSNIGLYGSYTQPLSPRALLTVGANLTGSQRRFATDDLVADSQFDQGTGSFNGALPLGENFDRTSMIFLDFGLGANLRLQAKQRNKYYENRRKRSRLDLGVGLHHLTRPDVSFAEDEEINLPMRLSVYGDGLLQVARKLDVRLALQAQFQQEYREYLGHIGLLLHVNRKRGRELAVVPTIGIRVNDFVDAWFPMLELHIHERWRLGVSYDVNISDFEIATDGRGGIEFSARYLFRRICPIPNVKYCPPFI